MRSTESTCATQTPQDAGYGILEQLRCAQVELHHAQLENRVLRLSAENELLRLQDHPGPLISHRAEQLIEVLIANGPETGWCDWSADVQELQAEADAM
jgi:hypothetical protein